MAAKKNLRAVAPDEKPPAAKAAAPKTIKAAVLESERGLLVALRDKVAAEIDSGVPAHTLAPLMKQLRELDRDIRAIDAREKDSQDEADEHDDDEAGNAPFDASAI